MRFFREKYPGTRRAMLGTSLTGTPIGLLQQQIRHQDLQPLIFFFQRRKAGSGRIVGSRAFQGKDTGRPAVPGLPAIIGLFTYLMTAAQFNHADVITFFSKNTKNFMYRMSFSRHMTPGSAPIRLWFSHASTGKIIEY